MADYLDMRSIRFLSRLLRKHKIKSISEIGDVNLTPSLTMLVKLNIGLMKFYGKGLLKE